ncbi:ABC transporter substrate-binding protein [Parapedobacter sp. 10938]|uniref:ABC transporter substrate-binding protein n=1 Tax=Parapedobacter flavus TaxID=3110225 RepID=UPI002DBEBCD7|nr:ABC transporter substrate-binding protein [Parapedobacter sp. 10938]MEC3881748.1 ABC transporter substrate-binding protein [Parapedobacter sp. 10938]
MILVRNLRLPLNGSKCLLGLSVLVLLAACTPKVRVLRAPGSKEPTEKTETPTKKEDTVAKPEEEEVVDFNQIALLLPFELDKANPHAPSAADIKRSALALDFYQGFKVGLDALSAEGANFKLNVLDTRDEASENVRVAKLAEVQDAALVVGPVYPKEIQVFGFNAKLDQALQISPLAASMPSEFNFPNLVTMTAPLPVHVRALAVHIADQYQQGDVVIFYRTPDEASKQLLVPLKSEIRKLKNGNIQVVEVEDEPSLESRVHLEGRNLIVLATTNRYEISPILAQLRRLQEELSYDIQLFGHPSWSKLGFDAEDGLAALDTRITTSYYIDKDAPGVRRFNQQYRSEFGISPTEFAYKGYDAAYYFGSLLVKYGPDYRLHLEDTAYEGLHNTFNWEYNAAWGYVNNAISILQYGSGGFRPIK